MKRKFIIYLIVSLAGLVSCTKNADIPAEGDCAIEIEVIDGHYQATRALILNNPNDNDPQTAINVGEFTLGAYLSGTGTRYMNDQWIYYFVPEDGAAARWRFKNTTSPYNLLNFYWPNDGKALDFYAYMPRDLKTCAADIADISFNNRTFSFRATMPESIADITEEDREQENERMEFAYATQFNQKKSNGSVKVRFVHPFAAIRFKLAQSHRDLTIHNITMHDLSTQGSFSNNEDTHTLYASDPSSQDYLILDYNDWTGNNNGNLVINLEKKVPDDVNYNSEIGGPYLVIPQQLKQDGQRDVKLSVTYSWDMYQNHKSSEISISTDGVPAWQPGNIYTYTLDLGDNKEEILFKVTVEPWQKGEENGYENSFEVK